MNRARKLVEMVVPDSDKVTTLNEMCEEDLKFLESVNCINEHDHENWAIDENGKEVDLNVYYDNSITVTIINNFKNLNNFYDYKFVMTDNINTFVSINAETEKNNVDDSIKEINSYVDCDDVSEYMSVNSMKIGRTSKEKASIKRVTGDPYMGSKVENGKCVQSCPKPGRYLKDCCVHNNKKKIRFQRVFLRNVHRSRS